MNPRYRRLLIPGLLVLLLVVVVVASFVQDAQASASSPGRHEVVSRVDDPRVTESSGLAVSRRHDDLAYTVNDSGNAAEVLAVRVSTGEVVGATRLLGEGYRDVEALALDSDGRLWVADTGDNRRERRDAALHVLPEPGEGDGEARPTTYPVGYGGASPDVEAVVVHDGTLTLLEKGLGGGTRYAVAVADLVPDRRTQVRAVADDVPPLVTDATATPDGSHVVLRTYLALHVLDAEWRPVATLEAPVARQGETVAAEPSGRTVLVGSEGTGQPLWRVDLELGGEPARPATAPLAAGDPAPSPGRADVVRTAGAGAAAVVGLGALGALAWIVLRRRRA